MHKKYYDEFLTVHELVLTLFEGKIFLYTSSIFQSCNFIERFLSQFLVFIYGIPTLNSQFFTLNMTVEGMG